MLNKEIEADADTFKIALLDNTHTPDQDAHDYFSDVVADEVSGTGYTAGGATLASFAATYDAGTNTIKLDATDPSWASSTITARYAVIYDATPGTDATRPLLVFIDFGADVSTTNGTFSITFNASGIATITVS
jgi:hypothetical protein